MNISIRFIAKGCTDAKCDIFKTQSGDRIKTRRKCKRICEKHILLATDDTVDVLKNSWINLTFVVVIENSRV